MEDTKQQNVEKNKRLKETELVRQDINFLEHPLWFLDERGASVPQLQDKEGYVYSTKSRVPTKSDALFLYYFLLRSQEKNWKEKLYLTRYEILRDCGLDNSQHWYRRLDDSLRRWKAIDIDFYGTFYVDGNKLQEIHFNIIDGWGYDEKNRFWICFSPLFLTRLQNSKFFKLVDFNIMKRLRSPLAIRLYEILSKSFKDRDTWSIDAMKLARKIPMAEKYPADVIPKLNAALNRINKHSPVRFEMSVSRPERGKAILTFRTVKEVKRQQEVQAEKLPKELQASYQKLIALVREKDRERMSVKIAIVKALQNYGVEAIRWSIECANAQSKRNYAAFFTNVLRNDYWLKQKEDKEEERKQRDKREAAIRAEYEKQKQEEAKRARERAEHDRAVAIRAKMTTKERENLRNEARNQISNKDNIPDSALDFMTEIYMNKIVLERESA